MFCEFLPTPGAGRDGDGARPEGLAAGDVTRRIADNIDLVRRKFAAVLFFRSSAGERPELVAIMMVVRERAELEEMPYTVVAEFELRAAGQVSGEKPKHDMPSSLQFLQQIE